MCVCLLSLRSTPIGRHAVLGWAPCAMQQPPTSCFTHDDVRVPVCFLNPSFPLLPPFKVVIDRHALAFIWLNVFWWFSYFSVTFFSWSVPL